GPTVKLIRFGGNDQDSLAGFAIDRQGNYYIAGTTASADLPANGFQSRPGGANLYRFRGPHMRSLYPPGASAISAIAADPSHRGYLYAAFSGAVWKSTDGGDTWKRLEADWPQKSSCYAIAVAPSDSATVYALCAGFYEAPFLFRSTDAGLTWTRRTGWVPSYVGWPGGALLTLEVDPHNASSLWSVAYDPTPGPDPLDDYTSVYSTDGGATWKPTDRAQFRRHAFFRFAFDNRRPGVIYAVAPEGPYRSGDGGQTWRRLPPPPEASAVTAKWEGPINSPIWEGFRNAQIAVLPSGDVLFLGSDLHRTLDNGVTWQTLPLPDTGGLCWRGPLPDPTLRVDPRSGSVYLRLCGADRSFAYRSDDAGATWTRLNTIGLPAFLGDAISSNAHGGTDYFAIVRQTLDAFVAKLSPSGDVIWSSYLGGILDDYATGMALDS